MIIRQRFYFTTHEHSLTAQPLGAFQTAVVSGPNLNSSFRGGRLLLQTHTSTFKALACTRQRQGMQPGCDGAGEGSGELSETTFFVGSSFGSLLHLRWRKCWRAAHKGYPGGGQGQLICAQDQKSHPYCSFETKGMNISRTSLATPELLLFRHLFGMLRPHQASWDINVVARPCSKLIPSFQMPDRLHSL